MMKLITAVAFGAMLTANITLASDAGYLDIDAVKSHLGLTTHQTVANTGPPPLP